MSASSAEPIQILEFPTTLRAKISQKSVFSRGDCARQLILARYSQVLSYTRKSFLYEGLGLTSLDRHILVHLYFFSLRRNQMELCFSFLWHSPPYLKFFGRRAWTEDWRFGPGICNLLDLHLFYCERRGFVHCSLADRNVALGCSLIEVTLAVWTRNIRKHRATSINIRVLTSGPRPLHFIIFVLIGLTVGSHMLSLSLGSYRPNLYYFTFCLRPDK